MSNLDQPATGEIAAAHFFVAIVVGRITRIDYHVPVIIRRTRIVAPDIGFGHLMKWIIGSRRQRGIIGKDLSDPKNAGGRPTIALVFSQARLALASDPTSPSQTVFSKQYRNRPCLRLPLSSRTFHQNQTSLHGIPVR